MRAQNLRNVTGGLKGGPREKPKNPRFYTRGPLYYYPEQNLNTWGKIGPKTGGENRSFLESIPPPFWLKFTPKKREDDKGNPFMASLPQISPRFSPQPRKKFPGKGKKPSGGPKLAVAPRKRKSAKGARAANKVASPQTPPKPRKMAPGPKLGWENQQMKTLAQPKFFPPLCFQSS